MARKEIENTTGEGNEKCRSHEEMEVNRRGKRRHKKASRTLAKASAREER